MMCAKGGHEFPIEDFRGAYCEEHGITLLRRGDPVPPDEGTPRGAARQLWIRPEWLALGPKPPALD